MKWHLGRVFVNVAASNIYILGVRSLANASRARQFKPLNPPGVGWVNFFFLGESIYLHMRAKFGRGPSRKIFNNI